MALEGGGSLVPKLEVGARHDGGDAETGFGVELGGGLAWTDPSLDLSGRTLIAHEDCDLEDRGVSASLAFDPAPSTQRGPSLSLRQEGRANGGLDALFVPEALEDRTDSEATSRRTMEAAYGFPAFGGRFTGSSHVGLGLATDRGREAGCPAPPAQIRTCPLGHPAPPSGSAMADADGKSLIRPRVSNERPGPVFLCNDFDLVQAEAVLLRSAA